MTAQVIDMDKHFDVDAQLEELSRKRFAMPPVVIAALRQAALKGTHRLLQMIEDDAIFGKMRPQDQLRVIELVMDRAYGKAETASSSALTHAKADALTGNAGKKNDHTAQLEAIAARAARRKQMSVEQMIEGSVTSTVSGDPSDVAGDLFPELNKRDDKAAALVDQARDAKAAARANVVALSHRRSN